MQQTKQLGNNGEAIVAQWLEGHGATILARNFTTRMGEIDVIATKGEIVAFVEVKTRNKEYFPIAQTVHFGKQQKIIKAAQMFILKNRIQDKVFRFDVATVVWDGDTHAISYIKNAFGMR